MNWIYEFSYINIKRFHYTYNNIIAYTWINGFTSYCIEYTMKTKEFSCNYSCNYSNAFNE